MKRARENGGVVNVNEEYEKLLEESNIRHDSRVLPIFGRDRGNFVSIDGSILHEARYTGKTYLFVFSRDCLKSPEPFAVGGISIETFVAHQVTRFEQKAGLEDSGVGLGICEVHKSHFTNDLVPAASPAPNFVVELLNMKERPILYDFTRTDVPLERLKFCDYFSLLTLLLDAHCDLLLDVSRNRREEISEARRDYHYECMLSSRRIADIHEDQNDTIQSCARYLVETYVAAENPVLGRWVAEQEETLLRFRLTRQYPSESSLFDFLSHNSLRFDVASDDEDTTECEVLFRNEFPGASLPTRWFKIPTIEALDVGLTCLVGSRVCIRDGTCYLSYKHMQMSFLPEKYRTLVVEKAYARDVLEREFPFLRDEGKRTVESLTGALTQFKAQSMAKGFDLPVEMDDPVAEGGFPPCQLMLADKLTRSRSRHLKYFERYQHSSFLLDCGWEDAKVLEHFKRNLLADGFTTDAVFDAKYSCMVNYKTKGLERTSSYGRNCETLTTQRNLLSIDRRLQKVGCPFAAAGKQELAEFCREQSVDIEEADTPRASCASFFRAKLKCLPPPNRGTAEWRPYSPHGYFNAAMRILANKSSHSGSLLSD